MESSNDPVNCNLTKIEHPLRYIAWAENAEDEQELEDALLNASETVVDMIARFCGFQEVGESQCGWYKERRFAVDPNIESRFTRPEVFMEFMEYIGCEIEYQKEDTIAVNVPENERFRMDNESLFES